MSIPRAHSNPDEWTIKTLNLIEKLIRRKYLYKYIQMRHPSNNNENN